MKQLFIITFFFVFAISCKTDKQLTAYVNPLLGTATLWEPEDLGYVRTWKERTWGAEVFPGSSLPNAMVQLSPVTQFRSGAGY
ncbi:MAG: glycoside hydrolase family 92 protein, partial [Proteiniphilum sp.]